MANRYLRATGNWNGAVWAATSGGAAGSAATPTSADDVILSNATGGYIVTLTADAECKSISQTGVSFKPQSAVLNGYKLHVYGNVTIYGSGGDAFVDAANGTLEIDGTAELQGVTNKNTSTIILNVNSTRTFPTYNGTFSDVIINMSGTSETLNITGSPTFRSLIIQSKNSAAHTVDFDDWSFVGVDKFIAIGSSSSNKLTIKAQSEESEIGFYEGYSSYGQFVNIVGVSATVEVGVNNTSYIGSNSTVSGDYGTWLLQDPPKISTLVDPLTTAPGSNANWTVTGTVTQVTTGLGGGGYNLINGVLTTTDTFDVVDNYLVVETNAVSGSLKLGAVGYTKWLSPNMFYRLRVTSAGVYTIDESADGIAWSNAYTTTVDSLLYRSLRPSFTGNDFMGSSNVLGSVGMLPAAPPAGNMLMMFQ